MVNKKQTLCPEKFGVQWMFNCTENNNEGKNLDTNKPQITIQAILDNFKKYAEAN